MCRPVTIKARTVVASITAANVVPPKLAPKIINKFSTVGTTDPPGGAGDAAQPAPRARLSPEKNGEINFKTGFERNC